MSECSTPAHNGHAQAETCATRRRSVYLATDPDSEDAATLARHLMNAGHTIPDLHPPAPLAPANAATARQRLREPDVEQDHRRRLRALRHADCCVLVRPCGPAAAQVAGYAAGLGKPVIELLAHRDRDLSPTCRLSGRLCVSPAEVLEALADDALFPGRPEPGEAHKRADAFDGVLGIARAMPSSQPQGFPPAPHETPPGEMAEENKAGPDPADRARAGHIKHLEDLLRRRNVGIGHLREQNAALRRQLGVATLPVDRAPTEDLTGAIDAIGKELCKRTGADFIAVRRGAGEPPPDAAAAAPSHQLQRLVAEAVRAALAELGRVA